MIDADIDPFIAATVDQKNPRDEWYWALMDYGAHLPNITANPNRRSRHYVKQPKFEGSNRQLRRKILKLLVGNNPPSASGQRNRYITRTLNISKKTEKVLIELSNEGFIKKRGQAYFLL